MSKIESFFSDYANNEVETHGDTESMCETFQGIMSGFAVEICEIDDGAHYTLSIVAHDVTAWNITADAFDVAQREGKGATLYRFETLAGAQEALSAFLSAAL